MPDPYVHLDATAQAALVARGEVTPLELVDAAIARVERLNPELNAIIHPLFDKARTQAGAADLPAGPLRGVPFVTSASPIRPLTTKPGSSPGAA